MIVVAAKALFRCVAIIGIVVSAKADSAELDSAESVADAHEAELKQPGLHVFDGYCFSVGTYRSTGTSDGATSTTEEGATLVAFSHYLAAALLLDDVPRAINAALKADVRKRAADVIIQRLRVSGIDEIDEEVDEQGNVRVVLAVEDGAVRKEKRHWNGCVDLIRESALEGNPSDAALWAEILAATGQDVKPAVEAWVKRLCKQPGLAATIRKTPFGVSDGWTKLPETIDGARISALTDERLLDLLDRRPFDGQLIDAYRDRLTAARRVVMSKATRTWHRVARAKTPMAAERVTETLAAAELADSMDVAGVAIVLRYADTWPVSKEAAASPEAVTLFRRGEVPAALRVLLRQFAAEPNSDGANYVAACLLAIERADAGEAWSRLAIGWNPTHPFASVNLMRALEQRGHLAEAKKLAGDLKGKAFLDDWGKSEVARILAPPAPPADPEKAPDAEKPSDAPKASDTAKPADIENPTP